MGSCLTDVGTDRGLQTHCRRNIGTCHIDIGTLLTVVLGDDVKVTEERELYSVVLLLGALPSDG